ncbi:MAG: hypothetical protein LBD06_10365 [Candidatus Accumulibacter sp.]|jgi:hypothetical protein|nr:hypothetical protein [Accumulibacter sp.]
MPVTNVNIGLNAFVDAARNASDNAALKVSGNTVQRAGGLGNFFTSAAAHRENMGRFLGALRATYGDHIANMASSMLATPMAQGKPLQAHMVKGITAFARQEQARMNAAARQSVDAFIADSGSNGLEAALNNTLVMRCKGGITPENMAALKERVAQELRNVADRGFFAKSEMPPDAPKLFSLLTQGAVGQGPLARIGNIAEDLGNDVINTRAGEAVKEEALGEMFPDSGMDRMESTPGFAAACARADLPGIELARLNPRDFMVAASSAMTAANTAAVQEGRVPGKEELLAAAQTAVSRELQGLQRTLDAIDQLPEADEGSLPRPGTFTRAQKEVMKETAQRYNLHDVTSLSALMEVSRTRESARAMHALAIPLATAAKLSEGIHTLAKAYREALPRMGENGPDSDVSLRIMQEMAARNAGFSKEQTAHLAANLNSDTAATVAGAFLMVMDNGLPGLSEEGRALAAAAYGMTRALHTTANVLAHGNIEPNRMLFTDATPLSRVPGGPNGCMDTLGSMFGEAAIGHAAIALSTHEPPFRTEEWNALLPIAGKAAQGPQGSLTASWISAAGTELLAAQRENGGRPLSNGQIWQVVTGFPMPRGVTDANFGERLHDAVFARYAATCSAMLPHLPPEKVESLFPALTAMGVSPRRVLELLAQPEAKLARADISTTLEMSSLHGYDPNTAYGLVTDFSRMGGKSVLVFENAQGNGHSIKPFHIDHRDDVPDNPDFQAIIGWARELTHGREIQTARVLQAFSQASTVIARQFSALFPGNAMDEHGHYNITARELPDGKVVVDIASDPSMPLDFRLQYTIDTDGSHECTGFEMGRWP